MDREVTATQTVAVEGVQGGLGDLLGGHRHKGEPARTTGIPIHHHLDLSDWALLRKQILKIFFGDVGGKVPDIQFSVHEDFLCSDRLPSLECSRLSSFKSSLKTFSTEDLPSLEMATSL
jgi:hypothetical protein